MSARIIIILKRAVPKGGMLRSQQKIAAKLTDLVPGRAISTPMLSYVPAGHYYWTGSGREALRQILLHLRGRLEKKIRVGVPAYTCGVVHDAVLRSGCEMVVYDSGVVCDALDIIPIVRSVDVLLVSYNFGFMPPMKDIAALCERSKVILIEDCAQALGAQLEGKIAGSFGSFAFYSFGISKNVGFCGGLIAAREEMRLLPMLEFPQKELAKIVGKVVISPFFFNKVLYPLTRVSLQKELHKEHCEMAYACPDYAKRVVFKQMKRYGQILVRRRDNGRLCLDLIKGIDVVRPEQGEPSWLYFVLLSNRAEELAKALRKRGVEVGQMLSFVSADESCMKANAAAREVLTFSLNRSEREIRYICRIISEVCQKEKY